MPRTSHELKTWPAFFPAVADGSKTFEVRLNDRDFKVGDLLTLREFNPATGNYTGAMVIREVTYVLFGEQFTQALRPGYAILGIKPVQA